MINAGLELSKLRNDFAAREIIVIDEFFEPSFAKQAFDCLNTALESNWYVSCYPMAPGMKKHKNLLNTKPNESFINHLRKLALSQYSDGNFSFRFKRTWYENDMPPEGAERELKLKFESDTMLSLIRQITGKNISKAASSFSSCYEKGDFLARHNDGNNGSLGFVYYLTPDWKTTWGGNIEFMNRKTLEPYVTFSPGYNQLLLFSIKDLAHLQHEVKMVSKDANGKRLAFSGWFK
jgi:Rps23 Pro-64 3,4-dihydroxylase Tpa1-like proline 4-hydroxylase